VLLMSRHQQTTADIETYANEAQRTLPVSLD
jgi:hypothetical protein